MGSYSNKWTFSATVTTLAAMADFQISPKAMGDTLIWSGQQGAAFFATSAATGAAATFVAALVKQGVIIAERTITVTPTTIRSDALSGGSGRYVCTVAVTGGVDNKMDLIGATSNSSGQSGPGLSGSDDGASWLLGCTALGGLTDVEMFVATTAVV